jgi:T5SS/PEP-CTERM-associated repeat protein
MTFIATRGYLPGAGFWTGSGDLTDPSGWLFDQAGVLVTVNSPALTSSTSQFWGGGTLSASGNFNYIDLAFGNYTLTGNLIAYDLQVGTLPDYSLPSDTAGLIVENGTSISTNLLGFGSWGGTTTVNIEGATVWAVWLGIGYLGYGTFPQAGPESFDQAGTGTSVVINASTISVAAGYVEGNYVSYGTIIIGYGGPATLDVQDGSTVTAGSLDVPDLEGSAATLVIDSSTMTVAGPITIGDGASATMTIQNDATVTAGGVAVGQNAVLNIVDNAALVLNFTVARSLLPLLANWSNPRRISRSRRSPLAQPTTQCQNRQLSARGASALTEATCAARRNAPCALPD